MASAKVSLSKYNSALRRVQNMQKKAKRVQAIGEQKMKFFAHSAETAVTGFGFGALRGYNKSKIELGGIPLEFIAAGVAHGAALLGFAGNMSDHLHAVGDGALTIAAFDLGEVVGRKGPAGVKEMLTPSKSSGMLGQRLTDDELEALTRD